MAKNKVVIPIEGDDKGFRKKLKGLEATAIKGAKAIAKSFVAVSGALVAAGGYAINLASDLEEVQNVVDVTFGKKGAAKIEKWAKEAKNAFGMSELQAKQFSGTLGAMVKSMGLSDDAVYDMSTELVQLAGDFASFYNLDHETAFEKIRSGISGETEPLKQLGINMSVTNLEAFALSQGITKAYNSMTQAEQATLRYNYLMSSGKDAQGDFARTAGSLANQLRTAKLELDELAASAGGVLIPIASDALSVLSDLTGQLKEGFDTGGIEGLVESLGDVGAQFVSELADRAPDMLDAAGDLIESFADGLVDNSDEIAEAAVDITESLVEAFGDAAPKAVGAVGKIGKSIAKELGEAYPILKPLTGTVELLADNIELCAAAFIAFKVATTGFAVLQGLTASFQTANVQLALFTLQNGKAALSSTTLTAALTAKELVVGVLTGKINLLTAAQTMLNKAWAANPVGIVVGGVTALVAGLALLNKAIDDSCVISNMLSNEMENLANKARGAREEFDSFSSMQEKNIESSESEFIQLQKLADELKVITDESGNVTDANKAQAEFILNELNEALGTEYTMLGNQIQQYQELAESIDILIMKKRAEAKLDYMNEAYKKANGEIEAQKELVKELSDQLAIAQEMEPYKGLEGKAAVQEAQTTLKDAQDLLKEYQEDIEDFNAAWIAVELGDYDALFNGTYKNYKAASEGMTTALEEGKAGVDETVDAINEKISFVIPNTADALSAFPTVINSAFGTSIESAKILGENLVLNFQNGTKKIMPNVISAAEDDGQLIVDALALAKELAPQLGTDYIQGIINGINARSSELWTTAFNAAQNITSGAKAGVRSNSPAKDGIDLGTDYVLGVEIGLEDEAPELNKTAKETAQDMNKSFADTLSKGMNTIRSEIASITGAIKEEAEKNVKAFDAELKKIEMLRDFGIDDEETYYRKLEFLRDNYLTKYSDKWIDITQELYDYQEAQLEEHRDNIEDVYDDIADHITDKLDEVAKKQQKFSDSLTDSTELFQKYTIDGVVHYKLNDFSSENVNLAAYQQWLSKAMERVKSSGASDDAISGVLDYIDGLAGDESGMDALIALASASDADFAKFMSGYAQNLSRADGIAAQRYSDDMVTAAEESYQQMVDELTKAGLDIPEGFFVSGTLSAEQFGEAFLSEIELQMQEIRKKLTEFNAEINASIGAAAGNVTNDNRSTTYHIYGDNSNSTVKQIQNMETIKRLSGQ